MLHTMSLWWFEVRAYLLPALAILVGIALAFVVGKLITR
jgi:hypothetical protein